MFAVLTSISIIILSFVLVVIIYVLRIVFDTQVKILKNHYRIQGQIELLTNLIAPLDSGLDSNMFRFVMSQAMPNAKKSSEDQASDNTTTVEVDMVSTETEQVKEVDQTKSDSDDSLPVQ